MKVQLLNATQNAMEVLIFTKRTRLEMDAQAFNEVYVMSGEEKLKELAYMANTIPSSWEFVDYTFLIQGVTRAFTHQFVRTRTGSFAQQSMRVTNQSGFETRKPQRVNENNVASDLWDNATDQIGRFYNTLVDLGIPLEDARGLLPTNILTNIVAKFNLRTLSDLVKSRSGGRTQDEYRQVIGKMADVVLEVHPWAHMFLFPRGREYFEQLEEATKRVADPAVRQDILKAIDHMRKQQG